MCNLHQKDWFTWVPQGFREANLFNSCGVPKRVWPGMTLQTSTLQTSTLNKSEKFPKHHCWANSVMNVEMKYLVKWKVSYWPKRYRQTFSQCLSQCYRRFEYLCSRYVYFLKIYVVYFRYPTAISIPECKRLIPLSLDIWKITKWKLLKMYWVLKTVA